jgi:hypothetical protein
MSANFMKKDSPNTFLFFGCWNNINCDNKYLYRDIILYTIKEFELYTDKVFIAGDNWYNFIANNNDVLKQIISKDESDLADMSAKDLTHYVTPILISGYYSLYNMNKDVYMCVGNHDETQDSQDNQDKIDGLELPSNKDCMITTQKFFNAKIKNTEYRNFNKFNYNNYNNDEENNPIFKFINSVSTDDYADELNLENLNDKYKEELKKQDINDPNFNSKEIMLYSGDDIEIKSFDNYMVLIINTNNFTNHNYISIIKNKLVKALSNELNNYYTKLEEESDFDSLSQFPGEYSIKDIIKKQKQVFVMGHFPLFYLKPNKNGKDTFTKNLEITNKTFDEFYKLLAEFNCIYLCADCHNFNIMKITKGDESVIQIMSGTGGANPDIIDEVVGDEEKILSGSANYDVVNDDTGALVRYNIEYNTINSYGYCKIILNKTEDKNIKTNIVYNQLVKAEHKEGQTDNNTIHYIKYYHIIEDSDVIFYKKQEKIAPLIFKEGFIKEIAKTSQYNKNVYCKADYITMNHVIKSKSKNIITNHPKICFNKKYKIGKNKIGKKDKEGKESKKENRKEGKKEDDKEGEESKKYKEGEDKKEDISDVYGGKKAKYMSKKETNKKCIKLKI